ncbi:glycosyltransferase [Hymenobacter cheonanensis]|uniref:glycosyltransferase n=1 Tax=Hymenobacter sp. CA2-7 TaxID=3063993 RepID=UPI002712F2EE|nr:glycosyltransferase [Hymenobacter sp. CA2-7]MDO7887382.1 glycosyltransferase [Hymenobacter sp. CA2-7]
MKPLLTGRDIVVVGQQPWDTALGSNCKDIAREFSRHNRVLYVNSPLDRNTVLRHRHEPAVQARLAVQRGQASGLQAVAPNLWVLSPGTVLESINWLPAGWLHRQANKLNNKRFAQAIGSGLAQLNFQDFVLFNDNDIFRSFHLKELLAPAVSVYYSRDFVVAGGYWRKHGLALEPALIAKSDVCVANSSYLADYCRLHNPQSFDVGQGCDALAPQPAGTPAPADVRPLPGPVVGYVGALTSARLDLEVLRYLSAQRPQWSIVLVGPEDEVFKASDLHRRPNVHFLGAKPTAELASYVQSFDVCLNPQAVNLLTVGNYPRKIDEYLALGKPVVATRTEAMRTFEQHTYLAESKEEYLTLIERALAEDDPGRQRRRRDFAATHTWENSVARIYAAIAAHQGGLATARPPASALTPALAPSL